MKKGFHIFFISLLWFIAPPTIAKPQYCSFQCTSQTFCGASCTLSSGEVVTCWDYGSPCSAADTVPYYYPNYWNSSSTTRENNNCYNYAANKKTNNFAQPGHKAGHLGFSGNPSCGGVMSGAVADSGIYSSSSSATHPYTLLAIVVAPNWDYHFYRRDRNGKWTHKPGQTNATNLDNSGNIITNPATANRGIYTDFCGYVKTKSKCLTDDCIRGLYGTDQNKGIANIGRLSGLMQQQINTDQVSKTLDPKTKLEATSIDGIKAEILIFSGLPNPIISFSAFNNISKRLATLNNHIQNDPLNDILSFDIAEAIPAKLGYKGILLSDSSGKTLPKDKQLHLYSNELRIIDSSNHTIAYHLLDLNLEQDILNEALSQGQITQSLRDSFQF